MDWTVSSLPLAPVSPEPPPLGLGSTFAWSPGLGLVSRCAPASPHSWPLSLSHQAQLSPTPSLALVPAHHQLQTSTPHIIGHSEPSRTIPRPLELSPPPSGPDEADDGLAPVWARLRPVTGVCWLHTHSIAGWGPRTLVSGERHATNRAELWSQKMNTTRFYDNRSGWQYFTVCTVNKHCIVPPSTNWLVGILKCLNEYCLP